MFSTQQSSRRRTRRPGSYDTPGKPVSSSLFPHNQQASTQKTSCLPKVAKCLASCDSIEASVLQEAFLMPSFIY